MYGYTSPGFAFLQPTEAAPDGWARYAISDEIFVIRQQDGSVTLTIDETSTDLSTNVATSLARALLSANARRSENSRNGK